MPSTLNEVGALKGRLSRIGVRIAKTLKASVVHEVLIVGHKEIWYRGNARRIGGVGTASSERRRCNNRPSRITDTRCLEEMSVDAALRFPDITDARSAVLTLEEIRSRRAPKVGGFAFPCIRGQSIVVVDNVAAVRESSVNLTGIPQLYPLGVGRDVIDQCIAVVGYDSIKAVLCFCASAVKPIEVWIRHS